MRNVDPPCASRMGRRIDAEDLLPANSVARFLTRIFFAKGGGGLAATLVAGCLVDQLIRVCTAKGLTLGSDGLPAHPRRYSCDTLHNPAFTLTETAPLAPTPPIWNPRRRAA